VLGSATGYRGSPADRRRPSPGAGRGLHRRRRTRAHRSTGARGLAGDLFVDRALGSRTARLSRPYDDSPDCGGNQYLATEDIHAHLRACTQAKVIRCGHRLEHLEMVSAGQAARLAAWGVTASVQPNFDALWGGPAGHVRQAPRSRARRAAEPVGAVSISRRATRVRIPQPGHRYRPVGHGSRSRQPPDRVERRFRVYGVRCGDPWRVPAAGIRDGGTGTLVPGAAASYAIWDAGALGSEAVSRVNRRSADPLSWVPALGPGDPSPRWLQTVHRGIAVYGDVQ
jgi:hypothetical protein